MYVYSNSSTGVKEWELLVIGMISEKSVQKNSNRIGLTKKGHWFIQNTVNLEILAEKIFSVLGFTDM